MYTAFFGLREKPFALSPDPRFLFLSAAHREALAHLLYGIEQGEGFIAVTGEVGTGKTTLCRTLLRRLSSEVEVAFLFNPKLSARELLEAIVIELGIEKRGASVRELVDELNQFLLERRQLRRRVLLIIDEAQGLAPDTLEQIRLLSNLETETEKLIQILLLGQPELDAMLASDGLRQLRQRIAVRWKLEPLSREETAEYVRHRLRVSAGADRDRIFSDAALREIYRRSFGVPRVVNLLCDRALLAGFGDSSPIIELSHVLQAVRETGVGANVTRRASRLRRAAAIVMATVIGVTIAGAWWLGADRLEHRAAALFAAATRTFRPTAPLAMPPVSTAASVAPIVEFAAPPPELVTDRSAQAAESSAQPAETSAQPAESSAQPAETLDPVDDLARALALRAPAATAEAALTGALDAWSLTAAEAETPPFWSFSELVTRLAAAGLRVLPLPDIDLEGLRAIAHPALLVVTAADGVPRIVLLRRTEGDDVDLIGVTEAGALRVPASVLDRDWNGEAYVVWREFEPLPELLRVSDRGDGVRWLQQSLAELGFSPGEPSGIFDRSTELAVRAFQADRHLPPDGTVGPLTKMWLYRALGRYEVPDLVARVAARGAG